MGYTQVVFNSRNRSSGTIDNAYFKFDNNMTVKSVSLKYFFMSDTLPVTPPDYLTISFNNWPFGGNTIQPANPVTTNQSCTFIVPVPGIITSTLVSAFFTSEIITQQRFLARGNPDPWDSTTVSLKINGQEPGVGINDWQMVLGIETV